MRAWIDQYKAVAPNVAITYEGAGSAVAVDRFKSGEGQFFTTDAPLSERDEATLGGSQAFVQAPWAAGAIAVVYNLPDVGELHLSPSTLSGIFGGRILRWDEPEIKADNPNIRLPNLAIQTIVRSDGSGTTQVFASYLQETAGWGLGLGFSVRFPRGQGVRGSEGMTAAVKRISGAIGYVGLAHARQAEIPVALLRNQAKRYVAPTPDAVRAALAGASLRPDGTVAKLYFLPQSPGAYPLSTLTYLIYRRTGLDPPVAAALRHFAVWALTTGQRDAEGLGYVVLPRPFAIASLNAIQSY
jgi:phosphate transport system substrate-binding protein